MSHVGTADDEKGQLIFSTNNDSGLQAALTINEAQKITAAADVQVTGDIILDDGGSLKEAGGTAALTFDGDGHVTKIGQDSPSSADVLTYDGAKWVASAPTVGDITGVTAGVGLSGGGTTGALTLTLDLSELSAITPTATDSFATLDSDGAVEQRTTITALSTLQAGTAATTGLSASSGVLSVSDLHPVGVDGANNQILTDDGDGTVSSEAKLTFDGTTLLVDTDVTATTNHTTVGAHIDYDATGIIASGQTGANVGLDVDINSNSPTMVGTVFNTGIDVDLVGGTSGAQTNIGLDISATGADENYGAMITGTTADIIVGTAGNTDATVITGRNQVSGTTAGKALTVQAGSGVQGASANVNGGDLILAAGSGDGTGTSSMQFKTKISGTDGSAERMRVHTDGNVGIGDAAPGTLLQLKGADAYLTLQNSTAENSNGGAETRIIFEDHGNNALGQIEVSHLGTSDDEKGKLVLSTNNDSGLVAAITIDDVQDVLFASNVNIAASHSYAVDGTAILSDSSGTMTLSNIDALDATTEATIESAIDTLSNLTTTGALNTGSITSGFTSIDVGAGAISTTGTTTTGILNATGSDPYVTLKNSTAENGEGGAESRVLFVDHADATLAQIEGSHSGTSDDTKGKFIVSTHNGSALTPALTINETQTSTFSGNVEVTTDLDNNFTALSLYNQSDSADTDGSVSLAFDLEDTAGTKVDAGMIQVVKEASFTSTASTQDSRMVIALSENGTLGAKATLTSGGNLLLAGDLQVSGNNIVDGGGAAGISFDGSGNTQIDLDVTIAGGDALLGTAGNTTATTISTITNTGAAVGKALTIAAGSTTTGSNNLNGGDLTLAAGGGDGTGSSSIVFKTKVSGTDAAAERLRIDVEGAVEANYATADAFGAGLSSAASTICKIAKINGVIETTILIDITGLDSHNSIDHVIGDSDGSAELTKVTFEKNGYIYRIEMACIEQPASAGSVTTNIKLTADTSARDAGYNFAGFGAGTDAVALVTGAWEAFQYEATAVSPAGSAVIAAGLDDRFLHLTTGAGSGGAGEYNAGKFMIKLYGVAF